MKQPRVSVIKNNIEKYTPIPNTNNDCEMGQWVDQLMMEKGHAIDRHGRVDMPEYNIDNKTRKKGSKASYTVGSMTIRGIINTANWKDTGYFPKTQNQNQVTWDPVFKEISNVTILDMDIPEIQDKLAEGYNDVRNQLISGNRSKEIKSKNGWVVLDGYGHQNSYRMRIPNKAMNDIKTLSAARDSLKLNFDFGE